MTAKLLLNPSREIGKDGTALAAPNVAGMPRSILSPARRGSNYAELFCSCNIQLLGAAQVETCLEHENGAAKREAAGNCFPAAWLDYGLNSGLLSYGPEVLLPTGSWNYNVR